MAKLIETKTYDLILNQEELDILCETLDAAEKELVSSMADLDKISIVHKIVGYLREHYRGDIPF